MLSIRSELKAVYTDNNIGATILLLLTVQQDNSNLDQNIFFNKEIVDQR